MQTQLQTSKPLVLFGEQYSIGIPNVGQELQIEAMKMTLTSGNYGDMVRAGTQSAKFNLDLVDAVSMFSIMLPDLKKKIGADSFMEMSLDKSKELIKVYRKEFMPWFDEIMKQLYLDLYDDAKVAETEDNTPK